MLVLDEIDKIGHDYKGDPGAALLEVLDPEQNCHFHDNYVDVDFDLSKVLFIATANTLSTVSQPLLDRMEIIDISGYLLEEKVEIAKRHLLPRIRQTHRLSDEELVISDEALAAVIRSYTSESGVRQLDKRLASIARKAVLEKMRGNDFPVLCFPSISTSCSASLRTLPSSTRAMTSPVLSQALPGRRPEARYLWLKRRLRQLKTAPSVLPAISAT